ncbi:hypothetical protein MKQ70_16615 [Chitinophaga sedimenti]|uniref:hypothetical protein n=1 Tax=Chitinophaga sedimenti TaxID=2033606 RepID=UPI002004D1A7|nr:hypothetical protein [Chitinophaga sedimenti]MCK7556551.1 hypothetical protein [Chitinophaga sedimenti]
MDENSVAEKWLDTCSDKFWGHLNTASTQHLGYNLAEKKEHLGNVYLFGCNPFVRRLSIKLVDGGQSLLLGFKLRKNKTLEGCKIVIDELRGGLVGWHIEYLINDVYTKVSLPSEPDVIEVRIIDKNGFLLEYCYCEWDNHLLNFDIVDRSVEYIMDAGKDEPKRFNVNKTVSDGPIKIGKHDKSLSRYFQRATQRKKFETAAASREFVFFSKGAAKC